nr:hypothetical protein [Thermoguttaceae bacterium]
RLHLSCEHGLDTFEQRLRFFEFFFRAFAAVFQQFDAAFCLKVAVINFGSLFVPAERLVAVSLKILDIAKINAQEIDGRLF